MYFYRAKRDFRSFNRNLSPPFAIFHREQFFVHPSSDMCGRKCPKLSEIFRGIPQISDVVWHNFTLSNSTVVRSIPQLKIKMSEIPRRTLTEDSKVKTSLKRFHSHIKTLTLSAAEGLDFYTDLKAVINGICSINAVEFCHLSV